jgi:ribosomal-protein-alanine N-acetyltransferase
MMTENRGLSIERLRAPVARADREAVLSLEAQCFPSSWAPSALDEMFDTPVGCVHVARLPGAGIVAFCGCWAIADELHVNWLAVDPPHRRRGIAEMLLQEVLRDTGARRATLEVRRSNEAAVALYAKLGFRVTAVRPRYYKNPEEDALILWLNP